MNFLLSNHYCSQMWIRINTSQFLPNQSINQSVNKFLNILLCRPHSIFWRELSFLDVIWFLLLLLLLFLFILWVVSENLFCLFWGFFLIFFLFHVFLWWIVEWYLKHLYWKLIFAFVCFFQSKSMKSVLYTYCFRWMLVKISHLLGTVFIKWFRLIARIIIHLLAQENSDHQMVMWLFSIKSPPYLKNMV